ncbi:hypothetical protein [Sphingomonas corticis]|uniref:Uncharacterized protein n=1 Tax=Sphingomonas corticis TaxID=2722791 RepID=A0ABX1CQP5_9SPHN|nr:hypothetical protein [Sphingomonas corticis]NJR80277.1 hypothetical protein [Sphingomonas corticis]
MKEITEAEREMQREQERVAADPVAAGNMARHMAALNLLLLGRRGYDQTDEEPIIQSGFRLTLGERDLLMAAAARLETDVVHLTFHIERAAGDPHGIMVFRVEGDLIACYPQCGLWAPAGGKRAVLVGLEREAPCHFVLRPGRSIAKVEGWPAAKLEAGLRRGANLLLKLAASDAMRDAHVGVSRGFVQFNGPGQWAYRSDKLAA